MLGLLWGIRLCGLITYFTAFTFRILIFHWSAFSASIGFSPCVNISHSSALFLPVSFPMNPQFPLSYCYYIVRQANIVFLKRFSERSYCRLYLFISWLPSIVSFMSREEDSCTLMRYGVLFGLVPHFVQHQWSSRFFFFFFYGEDSDFIQSFVEGVESKRHGQ